jgi:HEAT repeat protein
MSNRGRVGTWQGKIELNRRLGSLFTTALNSDDLRVRAAAIEIDIAARGLEKSGATIDGLEADARSGEQGARANALWDIALLGNRGVQPERAFEIVSAAIHDSNENVRYWAVEGMAYLGTDPTIEPLLGIFHDDPSANIRERAACGLAQSGMLNEKQRRTAVPNSSISLKIRRSTGKRATGYFKPCVTLRKNSSTRSRRVAEWYQNGDGPWNP